MTEPEKLVEKMVEGLGETPYFGTNEVKAKSMLRIVLESIERGEVVYAKGCGFEKEDTCRIELKPSFKKFLEGK